jgi:hypothetical protein
MKLIIREYLASLKEREELDAILPDLLSELGFIVYSRPGRGTIQHGVDVAAIGKDDDGEHKLFLFSVKQGDLTRQDWDGTPQGLRSSLDEIFDVYIPTKIPKKYKHLKIVICLCFGGDIQEQVRSAVTGYINRNATDRISFDEWNGDKISEFLLHGILREEILPRELRSSFQKAVAMADEPEASYEHFADLVRQLRKKAESSQRARVTVARQLYVCLWILFVWARDVDNIEAPYRASELALLNAWSLFVPLIGKKNANAKAISTVLGQLTMLHLNIASELLEKKVFPHVQKLDAISAGIRTRSAVDVNLKLFDLLGRIAMTGIWLHWIVSKTSPDDVKTREKVVEWSARGFQLIENNSALFSPLCDQHAIEISLFLLLTAYSGADQGDTARWLTGLANRFDFAVRTQGQYPCIFTDYQDLVEHPRTRSEEYLKDATSGSILIPLLASWLAALGLKEELGRLAELKRTKLEHCTLQLWLPDESTDDQLYIGGHDHGIALTDLPLSDSGEELLDTIAEACQKTEAIKKLSAVQTGHWPIVLLACRHYRNPVPPHFWIEMLRPDKSTPTT